MVRLLVLLVLAVLAAWPVRADDAVARGAYLAAAAGCQGCHTASAPGAVPYAGGHTLKTPKGTFFGPNITPDSVHGIGQWTEADFLRALRHGVRRDGANLYPVFPYTSYTRITDDDARAIFAFLKSLPPSSQPNKPHEIPFPYNVRMGMAVWKWLHFNPGSMTSAAGASPELARGA